MKLRRSIQVLARETPAPLRRFVKRVFVPVFLLRYLYPAPPAKRQGTKGRSQRSPAKITSHPFNYPARAARRPDGLRVTFRSVSPRDFFEDAFTHRTVTRIGGGRTRRFFPIDPAPIGTAPEGAPAGIIFHVRNCGSTLVCELLKLNRGILVYSEPRILHDVLALPNEWSREQIITGLRLVGSLFAAHAGAPYVWKLFSPNTLFCDLILQAFPQTPWIFCVRDPLEVAVADLASPPYLLTLFDDPLNPYLPYLLGGQHEDVSREVYLACAYAAFCRAIAKADWTRGRIVTYEDLPDAVWSTVAPHFSLAISQLEREAMAERALLHSKAKYGEEKVAFSPDSLWKRSSASEELRRAVDLYARPALADLLHRASKRP